MESSWAPKTFAKSARPVPRRCMVPRDVKRRELSRVLHPGQDGRLWASCIRAQESISSSSLLTWSKASLVVRLGPRPMESIDYRTSSRRTTKLQPHKPSTATSVVLPFRIIGASSARDSSSHLQKHPPWRAKADIEATVVEAQLPPTRRVIT